VTTGTRDLNYVHKDEILQGLTRHRPELPAGKYSAFCIIDSANRLPQVTFF
jgi:hypothetical protein